MKFAFTLICLLMFAGEISGQSLSPNKSPSRNEIYYDDELDVSIAPCSGNIEMYFSPTPKKSVAEFAKEKHLQFAINGSYFSGSRLLAKPAGWLRIQGKKLSKLSKSRQLTHVVRIDTSDRRVHFIPNAKFRTNPASICEFQAGPLVILNGKIQTELINDSQNGKGNYTRTMLARTAANRLYLITFRHPISLQEAAKALLEVPFFKKSKPTIINLDGGASVAFYSEDYPEYNFNTEDTLPLIIGVH